MNFKDSIAVVPGGGVIELPSMYLGRSLQVGIEETELKPMTN